MLLFANWYDFKFFFFIKLFVEDIFEFWHKLKAPSVASSPYYIILIPNVTKCVLVNIKQSFTHFDLINLGFLNYNFKSPFGQKN